MEIIKGLITCSIYRRTSLLFLKIIILSSSPFLTHPVFTQSVSGFTDWIAGHDPETQQLFPLDTNNCLTFYKGKPVARAKFKIQKYGEMSFPISPQTLLGEEPRKVNLSTSQHIKIRYKANQEVVLQLREYNVHGGVQNHIRLSSSKKFTTKKIPLSSFKGGKSPLNLSNVAKFNFAFIDRNADGDYSEIIVKSFKIHRYNPSKKTD